MVEDLKSTYSNKENEKDNRYKNEIVKNEKEINELKNEINDLTQLGLKDKELNSANVLIENENNLLKKQIKELNKNKGKNVDEIKILQNENENLKNEYNKILMDGKNYFSQLNNNFQEKIHNVCNNEYKKKLDKMNNRNSELAKITLSKE